MNRAFAFVAALLIIASAAYARDGVASETIRLRYLGPNNVADKFKSRPGIEQLNLNYGDNSVTVRGDDKAIAKFRADLKLADVQIQGYVLKMRLMRVHINSVGKRTETILMSPAITTLESMPATLSETQSKDGYQNSGFSISAAVFQNPDKTLNLTTEIRELGIDGEIVHSGSNVRNVKPGDIVRTVGMTDAKNVTLLRAVHRGEIVDTQGEYTAYCLDVKVEITSAAGK